MDKNTIYNKMVAKSVNRHYVERYYRFIFSRSGNIPIGETHHILPKSSDLFPEFEFDDWNKIKLTHREHFIAHWMLSKVFGGKQIFAFWAMCNRQSPQKDREYNVSSHVYEKARIIAAQKISEMNKHPNHRLSDQMKGTVMCRDSSGKILRVSAHKFHLNEDLVGVKQGIYPSHCKNESYLRDLKSRMIGRTHIFNPTTKEKKFVKLSDIDTYISEGFIQEFESYNRKERLKHCEFCGKDFDPTNYSRWHGPRCKMKSVSCNL